VAEVGITNDLEVARLKRSIANLEKDRDEARAQRDQALKDLDASDMIRSALVKSAADAAASNVAILDRFMQANLVVEAAIELRKAEGLKLAPAPREALLKTCVDKLRQKVDAYIKILEARS
jgi:hypothetical protein